jgi:hypothetical protein
VLCSIAVGGSANICLGIHHAKNYLRPFFEMDVPICGSQNRDVRSIGAGGEPFRAAPVFSPGTIETRVGAESFLWFVQKRFVF